MRLALRWKSPQWRRMMGTFALPWLCIVLFALLYYPYVQRKSKVAEVTSQLTTSSEMLALSVGAGLAESNFELVQMAFDWSKKDSNVFYLGILDERNNLFVEYNPTRRQVVHAQYLVTSGVQFDHDELVSVAPVIQKNQRLGTIILMYSLTSVEAAIREQQIVSIFVSLVVLAIGLSGTSLLARQSQQLQEAKLQAERQAILLQEQANQLSKTNFELEKSNAELHDAKLAIQQAHDMLERRVEERTSMLAKANRELERKNKDLNSFAYIVSHDLKAPLRAIGSLVDWLATDHSESIGEEGRQLLDLLLRRTKRMHDLIEGILRYSRIGRTAEKPALVDFNEVIRDVIDGLDVPKNVSVEVQSDLPTLVCEQTQIRQVFQNLINNAAKFMDKRNGRIRVTGSENNSIWRFCVEDNGPGIEERYFEKIFQMFQTLNARDNFESTGVGLTIVKKIVEMSDGKVWVESSVGEGSKFFFTWPARCS